MQHPTQFTPRLGHPPPPSTSPAPAIADTGASAHYLVSTAPCTDKRTASPGIHVELPNGASLHSSHTATLQLHPSLPPAACESHIFPDFAHSSLLSIGQLCDNGCIATFDATTVSIAYQGTTIITGTRCPTTRLWNVDLQALQSHFVADPVDRPLPFHSCNAVNPHTTIADRIAFYHACCFSPVLSTWCKAIDEGRFTTWPELTSALVRRHPPHSVAMIKGHLDQERANQRSTHATTPAPAPPPDSSPAASPDLSDNSSPLPTEPSVLRTHSIYADCQPISGQLHSDQTGRFLCPSSTGNSYLLIVYDYDSNSILAEPMKNRTGPEHRAAYERVHTLLTSRGLRPQLQRLDNEASATLQQFL